MSKKGGKFSKYLNYLRFLISLFVIWIFLSMKNDRFLIISGIFSIFATFIICHRFRIFMRIDSIFRLGFIKYSLTLLKYIIHSSYDLMSKIINEKDTFKSGFIKVNVSYLSIKEKVLFSNIITMTPGSFVVNVQDGVFLIHSINVDEIKSLDTEKIMKLIKNTK